MLHGEESVHKLVASIYDRATLLEEWGGILEDIGDAIGGLGFVMSLVKKGAVQFSTTPGIDDHYHSLLRMHYSSPSTNLLMARMPELPVGRALARPSVASDDAYFRSGLYNDAFRPQKSRHVALSCLLREGDVLMPCGIVRSDSREDLSERELRLLDILLLHVHQAARIMLRTGALDMARHAGESALDCLPLGVILVSPDGRALFVNAAAEKIVVANDGLGVRDGALIAATPRETRALQELLARCIATGSGAGLAGGGTLRLSRPSMRPPFCVMVVPLRPGTLGLDMFRPAAAVFVNDPVRAIGPFSEVLCQGFGLSQAEASLLSVILQGYDLNAAAGELGIAATTARTHLKHIFDKVGTRRQTDLIRRVVDSAAWIASRTP